MHRLVGGQLAPLLARVASSPLENGDDDAMDRDAALGLGDKGGFGNRRPPSDYGAKCRKG
jgi:hypothetical protein